jgi:beta-propeller repeat-containing protein
MRRLVFAMFGTLLIPTVSAWAAEKRLDVTGAYAKIPLSFEENRGQTDCAVRFLAHGAHQLVFLTTSEAVLVLNTPKGTPTDRVGVMPSSEAPPDTLAPLVLRLRFVGANSKPTVTGLEQLPGNSNYFIGNDPVNWHVGIPTYARVQYVGLYPGIDAAFFGDAGKLGYDFVVHPEADPSNIELEFQGTQKVDVTDGGDLAIQMADRVIWQQKPVLFQEIDGVRREVRGGYVLKTGRRIGFRVGTYNKRKALVIDPWLFPAKLAYSTYLGGSNNDFGSAIAVDASGAVYVTGSTSSTNFPTTTGPRFHGDFDAFVTKLNPTGSALVYSVYLGGNGRDQGFGIAVDASGYIYVTGSTTSSNFPTTPGAFQTQCTACPSGGANAFVAKLFVSGLLSSTYLGGSGSDSAHSIAVDGQGNVYVTGSTSSTNFPTTSSAFQTQCTACPSGRANAFVTQFAPGLDVLINSTYLGGSGSDIGEGIAVDGKGNAYVTGTTPSINFPTTAGAFQRSYGSGHPNAFVTKFYLDPKFGAARPVYSTFLGGNGINYGSGIAVDGSGSAYVTGSTNAIDFPTTPGAFQTTPSPKDAKVTVCSESSGTPVRCPDAFVTKLNTEPRGPRLLYSTYLGGNGRDGGSGIALGLAFCPGTVAVYVTGSTSSTNFPATTPQKTYGGGYADAFVAKLLGGGLIYSTYLGGDDADVSAAIAVDGSGAAYVAGSTRSANFPATPGAFRTTYPGGVGAAGDAFVSKITEGITILCGPHIFPNAPQLSIILSSRAFVMNGAFAPDVAPGWSPVTEPVTVLVGNDFSATIPPGSFKRTPNGSFAFKGIVNGVRLEARLTPTERDEKRGNHGRAYSFMIKGDGAYNLPTTNPVQVLLAIGNNAGSASVERAVITAGRP